MNKDWRELVVKSVSNAVYVARGLGKASHKDRPYHGLVINSPGTVNDYFFRDGTVMHTEGGSLFYLPRGSTYETKATSFFGCYAINFEADISDEPFTVSLRNNERVFNDFRATTNEWRRNGESRSTLAMCAIYSAISAVIKETEREYIPSGKVGILTPVIEEIDKRFTEDISVKELAERAGVSEVYMRRIFSSVYGISPKEYIISRRIEYAKRLLITGDFSVSAVASSVGYSEPCHFSREFTRRVGASPSDFAKGKGNR